MLAVITNICRALTWLALTAALTALTGCSEQQTDFREIRRVDESLTEADLDKLVRMAEIMIEGRLPEMAPHFLPEPSWDPDRPAAISTLVAEELTRLEDATNLAYVASSIGSEPRLDFACRKERLSREQYVGLLLSVGLAYQRYLLDPARDLVTYQRVGQEALKELKQREDSFATLSTEERVDALDQATWITRVDRARRVSDVPNANVRLVGERSEQLEAILPEQFLLDPLQGLNDPRIDFGIPFRELGKTGFDADIIWDKQRDQAIIGGESTAAESEAGWSL